MKIFEVMSLALALTGCTGTKPLKGGKATTSSLPMRGAE